MDQNFHRNIDFIGLHGAMSQEKCGYGAALVTILWYECKNVFVWVNSVFLNYLLHLKRSRWPKLIKYSGTAICVTFG